MFQQTSFYLSFLNSEIRKLPILKLPSKNRRITFGVILIIKFLIAPAGIGNKSALLPDMNTDLTDNDLPTARLQLLIE